MKLKMSVILFLVMLLAACGSELEIEKSRVVEVGISKSGWDSIEKPESFISYGEEEQQEIELFKSALTDSKKIKNMVNVVRPNYDVSFTLEDGEVITYHLWLGEKGKKSTFMEQGVPKTLYASPSNHTEKLMEHIIIGEIN